MKGRRSKAGGASGFGEMGAWQANGNGAWLLALRRARGAQQVNSNNAVSDVAEGLGQSRLTAMVHGF